MSNLITDSIGTSNRTYKEENITPIAVYDVEDKKLVLIFFSTKATSIYLQDSKEARNILGYAKKRTKLHTNVFNRVLAIKIANTEQVKMLGQEQYICLDDRFKRDKLKHKLQSEMQ